MPSRPPWHRVKAARMDKGPAPRRERDPQAQAFYNSTRWKRARKVAMDRTCRLCSDPYGEHQRAGITMPADDVHHIQPRAKRPDLELVDSNLMPLCRACHNRLDADKRRQKEIVPE